MCLLRLLIAVLGALLAASNAFAQAEVGLVNIISGEAAFRANGTAASVVSFK